MDGSTNKSTRKEAAFCLGPHKYSVIQEKNIKTMGEGLACPHVYVCAIMYSCTHTSMIIWKHTRIEEGRYGGWQADFEKLPRFSVNHSHPLGTISVSL